MVYIIPLTKYKVLFYQSWKKAVLSEIHFWDFLIESIYGDRNLNGFVKSNKFCSSFAAWVPLRLLTADLETDYTSNQAVIMSVPLRELWLV